MPIRDKSLPAPNPHLTLKPNTPPAPRQDIRGLDWYDECDAGHFLGRDDDLGRSIGWLDYTVILSHLGSDESASDNKEANISGHPDDDQPRPLARAPRTGIERDVVRRELRCQLAFLTHAFLSSSETTPLAHPAPPKSDRSRRSIYCRDPELLFS